MKVALVSASLSSQAGGIFDAVRNLSHQLARRDNISVEVVGLNDDRFAHDCHLWHPLHPYTFRSIGPRAFGYSPGMGGKLNEISPDLLHAHGLWMYPSVASAAWSWKHPRREVISPHGMLDAWALKNASWKKWLASLLYEGAHLRRAACIHALCKREADAIRAYGLLNPICVIPNGIHIPRRASPNYGEQTLVLNKNGRKVLLYLGRIHPKKGLENLVAAWGAIQESQLRRQNCPWVLAIVGWGQGDHEMALKKLSCKLDIATGTMTVRQFWLEPTKNEASLFFLGPAFGEDKDMCYRNCDAFILPSFSEGLPMVILEAWANAKPVLMTAQCNLPEGFATGAAIQIEPTKESIAKALLSFLPCSPSVLHAMGAAGRALAAKRFSWHVIGKQMKAVYQWVLGDAEAPSCLIN